MGLCLVGGVSEMRREGSWGSEVLAAKERAVSEGKGQVQADSQEVGTDIMGVLQNGVLENGEPKVGP
jgi:hypothetical protein